MWFEVLRLFSILQVAGCDSAAASRSGCSDVVEVIPASSTTPTRTFTCSECQRDFASEKYLNMHMSLHLQSLSATALASPASPGSMLGAGPADLSTSTVVCISLYCGTSLRISVKAQLNRTELNFSGLSSKKCVIRLHVYITSSNHLAALL